MKPMLTANEARALQRQNRLRRFNEKLRDADTLSPPTANGLIPPDNLTPSSVQLDGLEVQIPEWGRVLPNDKLYIVWQGELTNIAYVVTDPETQVFPITIQIPSSYFSTNGSYIISYSVAATSGAPASSAPLVIKVDTEAPNQGNIPGALIYPDEVIKNGLTLEYLSQNKNQVIATVPSYTKMEAGQVVNPVWASINLPSITVTADDVKAGKVSVNIPTDIITQSGEGSIESHYTLTSRAGFDGLESDPALVNVILTPVPANLKAPVVPLAVDGLIDLPDADAGVTVEISQYSNALTGDNIIAKWGSASLAANTVISDNFPVEISVPREIVISEGTGTINVSYQVIRKGNIYDAPAITVEVDVDHVGPENPDEGTPVNEALDPPEVKGSTGETNALEPADAGKVATVTVPLYENAKIGEIITVYWGSGAQSQILDTHSVTQTDLDNDAFEDFIVSADIVDSTPNDPEWPVHYTLSRATEPANPVLSPTQLVNVYLTGPSNLVPPVLPDINELGWLLIEAVENGAAVSIPVYENMANGDVVTIYWQAFSTTNAAEGTEIENSAYESNKTVGAPELANGIAFTVPYQEYIDPIASASPYAQGSAQIKYTVNQAGHEFASEMVVVPIDLGHP